MRMFNSDLSKEELEDILEDVRTRLEELRDNITDELDALEEMASGIY